MQWKCTLTVQLQRVRRRRRRRTSTVLPGVKSSSELIEAANQTASSPALKMDAVSRDFFSHFWSILKPDLQLR